MNLEQKLQKLSDAFGVAGFEDEVREVLHGMVSPYVESCETDPLGNLTCSRGSGDAVMLDAHMDEVGFMVKWIEKDGFLRLTALGGWDDRILMAHRLTILTRSGEKVHGVIGSTPPHIQSDGDRDKVVPLDDLFVDIGARSRDEAEAFGVHIGDPATIHYPFLRLQEGYVTGKAFDDRAGCLVAAEALRILAKEKLPYKLVVNFAVHEEGGLRGAKAAAYRIAPKLALALEGTIGADMPGVPEAKQPVRLGHGPAITLADRSITVKPKLARFLEKIADENGIGYQYKLPAYGSTDAGAIHLERGGILTGVVSVPCRYIHSPVSTLYLSDLEATLDLVVAFLRRAGELL
ncbi:MAG: M42 family metallopeptidase [Candidatus Bipolaricaulis anaerobius]|nr:M42 family metallopeptidase [Candidatus Bipolaricaulis sp.]MDD3747882.1 M42 family metallopeptidase [Candidatus Bipolaricaulis anaerobius]MDD5764311.1 M42 family metallopeptidase [Candidatus Bipolaricaulis anaerobius]HQM38145.1 M42 family metallopeptidase [Candidatus Bipolaricaulis anaerobius]